MQGKAILIVLVSVIFGTCSALYCCNQQEDNTLVAFDTCGKNPFQDTLNGICNTCRQVRWDKGGGDWTIVRDCVTEYRAAETCTEEFGRTTCYCNVDLCNSSIQNTLPVLVMLVSVVMALLLLHVQY